MSSIWEFFRGLVTTASHPPTVISIKPSNYVRDDLPPENRQALIGTPATAEHQYVRLWVTRMLLTESTKWFTTLYPAVYSAVHLHFGDTDVDLTNIAGPKQLGNLQPTDTNHSLQINSAMTGLLPFRGGTIRLSCGLVSMPVSNLLANFLNTVGDFANKLAQPQVSAYIGLASSIATGVQSLLGVGSAKLVLYYDSTFTGMPGEQTLQSGFIYISDEPAGATAPDQIWIIEGEPRIGSSRANARTITGHNYALIQVELVTERDDWEQFKTIEGPLQQAIAAKISGKTTDADNFLITARLAAYNSQDLTNFDRIRVIKAIDTAYHDATDAMSPHLLALSSKISLAAIMKTALPVHDALRMELPTREALLSVPMINNFT